MLPFEMAMVANMVKIGHFEAFGAKMAIIAMTIALYGKKAQILLLAKM